MKESVEMLKEAERIGAVKIMIPTSELKFMLQQVSKVEEMQKTLEWAARIIDSGMYKGILQYDPKEWFVEYWKLKGDSQ